MAKLGVNIDHVATLRQARGTRYPDPIAAAAMAEAAGADQITVHLREDRRHIQEADVRLLLRSVQTELNLESAVTDDQVGLILDMKPQSVTFVPERRQELTTEGGLDAVGLQKKLRKIVPALQKAGVRVSLFIHPDRKVVECAKELAVDAIELHTGAYAEARSDETRLIKLRELAETAQLAKSLDLWVAAGHGLNYQNIGPVAAIREIVEFNIGHAIVARSVFVGLGPAVSEMKKLVG